MARAASDPAIPSEQDAFLARQLSRVLETQAGQGDQLRLQFATPGKKATSLEMPASAAEPLLAILKAMGEGKPVAVHVADRELTAQQAADLLNVPLTYLGGLIENGVLPARITGDQRLLPLKDVLAYMRDSRAKRRAALDELAKLDQELGLR